MSKRNLIKILFMLLLAMTAAPQLKAQEIVLEGPLVGQPAVRKMLILRKGRINVMPNLGFSLLDTYRRNVFMGLKLEYSPLEWLAIGLWGVGSINRGSCADDHCSALDTKLTKEIESKARANVMNIPDPSKMKEQIGTINGLLTLQLTLIPLRGKLGLFKSLFLASDFYLFAGVGVGFIKDRGLAADELYDSQHNTSVATCIDQNPRDGKADDYGQCMNMKSRVVAVGTFGAGLDLFVNNWLAINIEYRGIPLKYNVSGTDEYGRNAAGDEEDPGYSNSKAGFPDHKIDGKDQVLTLIHSINIGVSFFLTLGGSQGPLKAKITD